MSNKTKKFNWSLINILFVIICAIYLYGCPDINWLQKKENNKINTVLTLIHNNYVDSINMHSLIDYSIENTLNNLDPHSIYMTKEEVTASMADMQGSFEGIGVEFTIHQDTIIVVNVIPNGPSERKGLDAGDRIVSVNQKNVAGIGITNKDVIDKLRGVGGTKVTVGIQNKNSSVINLIEITRGKIPLHSLDVAYEISPTVGYIKLNRFSETTYHEFKTELIKLTKENGINSLILDLRGNTGGYLDQAIKILNELFDKNELLVYTKGQARKEQKYYSDKNGHFKTGKICVLIDRHSASASEIIAGAIQDNDRGEIVGEKSFGKGLVQEQIPLQDGSLIRLTVSRYYTPSGRCIQKPYTNEDINYYPGNNFIDSTLLFKTKDGETVHGGGGITPDIIVSDNTLQLPTYIIQLYNSTFFNELAFNYVDNNREMMNRINAEEFFISKIDKNEIFSKIKLWMTQNTHKSKDTPEINHQIQEYEDDIINRLNTLIIRQHWGWSEMHMFLNETDEVIISSLSLLK